MKIWNCKHYICICQLLKPTLRKHTHTLNLVCVARGQLSALLWVCSSNAGIIKYYKLSCFVRQHTLPAKVTQVWRVELKPAKCCCNFNWCRGRLHTELLFISCLLIMADETTPLTASSSGYVALPPYQGPTYVFPGGVSPRSRRSRMKQFQCCITITFM